MKWIRCISSRQISFSIRYIKQSAINDGRGFSHLFVAASSNCILGIWKKSSRVQIVYEGEIRATSPSRRRCWYTRWSVTACFFALLFIAFLSVRQLTFHKVNLDKWKLLVDSLQASMCKEGCNWGHGLSAALKLGSLEKTVGASPLHSGVYYEQSFLCRKN